MINSQDSFDTNNGTLYGVGVGPGDPELLTLKALRIIKECEYIALPATSKENCTAYTIVQAVLPEIADKSFLYLHMPMTKDVKLLTECHAQGADKLTSVLSTGASIAFLTLGDPCIYSTYLYLHKLVTERHYKTELVNGIPSFCAASAALNLGLVEQAEPLHIYPASYSIEESLALQGTKIYMKSGTQLATVRDTLLQHSATVAMVENCGMENEHIYQNGTSIPDTAGYYSILISKS